MHEQISSHPPREMSGRGGWEGREGGRISSSCFWFRFMKYEYTCVDQQGRCVEHTAILGPLPRVMPHRQHQRRVGTILWVPKELAVVCRCAASSSAGRAGAKLQYVVFFWRSGERQTLRVCRFLFFFFFIFFDKEMKGRSVAMTGQRISKRFGATAGQRFRRSCDGSCRGSSDGVHFFKRLTCYCV